MADRPFLKPQLRMSVEFPDAEQLMTPSNIDILEAEVSKHVRDRDAMPTGGVITTYTDNNEVVFDLNDDISNVRELNIIQEEIINAFDNIINFEVEPEDVVVRAEIVRVFSFGLE